MVEIFDFKKEDAEPYPMLFKTFCDSYCLFRNCYQLSPTKHLAHASTFYSQTLAFVVVLYSLQFVKYFQ